MCEQCAVLEKQLHAAIVDVENLQAEMTVLLRKNTNLKKDLDGRRADGPKHADAREVFDHWVKLCDKDEKRTKFDPAREKAIQARLNEGRTVADCKRAIYGLSVRRHAGPHGRTMEPHPGSKPYDQLVAHCMKDAETFERCVGYADQHELERTEGSKHVVKQANRDATTKYGRDTLTDRIRFHAGGLETVLRALEERGCTSKQLGYDSGKHVAQCPAHDDRSPSLSVRECDDGRVLLHCFAGCETRSIVEALGLSWADLFDDIKGGALNSAQQQRFGAA